MKKVIVIGAGPAGLTAAYELLQQSKDLEVVILEGGNDVGGISRTICWHGNRMDIGGHRFFSKDDKVMDWWRQRMPIQGAPSIDDKILNRQKPLAAAGPDPEKDDRVMLVRQRVSRIYYQKHFFDYPIRMKPQTFRNMGFRQTVKAGFSYLHAMCRKLPEDSLENFYINRFGRVLYSMFFEGYTEKLWGRHPRDISAEWGAQRVKGLSISAVIKDMLSKILPKSKNRQVETSLIEEFIYPKFGPGQLWETVAAEVEAKGGRLMKNCQVTSLTMKENRITGVVYEHDGHSMELEGDCVISSMPIKDLVAGLGNAVPEAVRADCRRAALPRFCYGGPFGQQAQFGK